MEAVSEVVEESDVGGVREGAGEVRNEGVGDAVELEANEYVEGEALVVRREEVLDQSMGLRRGCWLDWELRRM